MPTFGDLIDEVISTLHGHVDLPAMGSLVGAIDADDTSLKIDFGDSPGASRPNGIIEIDSELLVVSRYDVTTGTATVTPWGRGHRGTTASAHLDGAMVTVRPRFPRKRVAEQIKSIVRQCCPPLYAARDLAPIAVGAFMDIGYDLPDDTMRVLRVDATRNAADLILGDRMVLRDWTVRTVAGTQQLEIRDCFPYANVIVTIAAQPGELVNESDDFAAVTGLPDSVADAVVMGALSQLVLGVELARQQVITPEAMARADKVPVQSGMAVSRFYASLYAQRIAQEQDRLNQQYPIQLLRRG